MTQKSTVNPKPSKKSSTKKTRKRTRKTHYHTGTHLSKKCPTPIEYRSGWELTICEYLDNDPNVVSYLYEGLVIHYTSNQKSKKLRKYLPDFLVTYKDGKIKMVEVKRENQLTNLRVQKKAEAARLWCSQQNPQVQYEFWTDKMVLPLQKAAKLRQKVLQAKTLKPTPTKKLK